jgi:tetratricopeptide (TPR) repeat protein
MAELSATVHSQIEALCERGDQLAADRRFEEAISAYNQAWELIPEPRTDWNASTWVLAAIENACFLGGFYTSGVEALTYAMRCPDAIGNPFLHLRLGQCYLERGQLDSAADELARAYMAEGRDIFARDDGKYFAFLTTRIKPPASGVW